ncbi:MAG: DUF1592 domain-containing protein [Polyangiaceae bacterium]|nr:DUF1592 domain-containing protein [Polyangiaceae bacterium]
MRLKPSRSVPLVLLLSSLGCSTEVPRSGPGGAPSSQLDGPSGSAQPLPPEVVMPGGPGSGVPPIANPGLCTTAALAPARVRKVTDAQYANLVSDLFPGITPLAVVTPGAESATLKDTDEFVVRGPLANQYYLAAVDTAAQVVRQLSAWVPCSTAVSDIATRTSCATDFIRTFAPRAYRRPLASAEEAALLAVFEVGAAESFSRGVELVVQAVLQSADFIYRTELGEATAPGPELALTPHEVASSLSFFFLDRGPDAELLQAASLGSLSNVDQVKAQIARLMAMPDVQARMNRLLIQVLGADKSLTAERDPALFPQLDAALRSSMAEEVNQLVNENVWGSGSLPALFTSTRGLINAQLRAFYGVAAGASTTPELVDLPANQRSGILTRAGTLLSLRPGSRAVHRGLFLLERYLCRQVPTPPAALQSQIDSLRAQNLTEREIADLRASKPECSACHAQFDGLGLAFEHYDLIGSYLTERDGAPVNATGVITGTDVDGPFDGVLELSSRFSTSSDVASCLSQKVASFALGRLLDDQQACSVKQLVEPWTKGPKRLDDLLRLLTSSQLFLQRTKGT